MINDQIESDASHDFDVISHESCSYDDPGKGLQVDVEQVVGKIFGSNQVYQTQTNAFYNMKFLTEKRNLIVECIYFRVTILLMKVITRQMLLSLQLKSPAEI